MIPARRVVCRLAVLAFLVTLPPTGGCAKSSKRDATAAAATTKPSTAPVALRTSPGPYHGMPMRVLAVDDRSITVRQRFPMQGRPTPGDRTLKLDPKRTQVFAHVVTSERENAQGRVVQSTKTRPATFADLKPDQQVQLGAPADGDVATDILILPPPPQRLTTRAATRATTRVRPATRRARPMTTSPTTQATPPG